jgi:hypothetical protein
MQRKCEDRFDREERRKMKGCHLCTSILFIQKNIVLLLNLLDHHAAPPLEIMRTMCSKNDDISCYPASPQQKPRPHKARNHSIRLSNILWIAAAADALYM